MKLLITGFTSKIAQELIKKFNEEVKVKISTVGRHKNSDYYCCVFPLASVAISVDAGSSFSVCVVIYSLFTFSCCNL